MTRRQSNDLNAAPMHINDKIVCWACLVALFICIMLLAETGHAAPVKVMVQPSNGFVNVQGYDSHLQPVTVADPDLNVAIQAAMPVSNAILWVGFKDEPGIAERYPRMLAAAQRYGHLFTYVLVIDELFWCDTGFCMGKYEDGMNAGCAMARAAGFRSIITILPDVILRPDFHLKDVNACDAIAIDIYPSARPSTPDLQGCSSGVNDLGDLLYCSIRKLRAMGFAGNTGYVYQAFGLKNEPLDVLHRNLLRQREVIDRAQQLGADAVMTFGMYLGAAELQRDPALIPLGSLEKAGDTMTTTTLNWSLAIVVALLMAAACNLDGPDDHSTEMAQAADLEAAIKTEAARARFTRAAAEMCGNSGWAQDADGTVRCVPRKGQSKGAVLMVNFPAQVQP